jgi:flagellar biogenesis protein FliO
VTLARLRASPPSRARVVAACCAALALVAATAGGDLAGGALRASAVVALLAVAAVAVRPLGRGAARASSLVVEERQAFTRDSGIALVAAGPRRLVVGYGTAGVRLLADLDPRAAQGTP